MATSLGRVKLELKMRQVWHLISQLVGTCLLIAQLRTFGYYWMHARLLYSFEMLMY